MFFYITIAFFTSYLFFLSVLADKNGSKFGSRLFFALFILLPSLVGGLRDKNIGEDMLGYGQAYFYDACKYNLRLLFEDTTTKEYGYFFLNWVCAQITHKINFFLFVAEALKMIFIGLTAWHFKKESSSFIFIITYMLFFWWYGFSMMRQSIAITICIYSLVLFLRKKYLYFILSVFFAYEFHNSAIFFLLLILLLLIKSQKIKFIIIIIGSFAVLAIWQSAILYMADSGFFRGDLSNYIDSGVSTAKSNVALALVFMLFTLYLTLKKIVLKHKEYIPIILDMSIITLLILFMSTYIETAFRISYYSMIIIIILMPTIIREMPKIISIGYVSLFFIHYYFMAMHGAAGTIPYTSKILGI